MGLGILILLPKHLREGFIYVFHPGYHGNADTTIKFCRPYTLHSPYQEIVSVFSKFPLGLLIINNLTLVTMVTAFKVAWKAQVIILSGYQKILTQKIGIPFYIRLLYSFRVFFIAL